MLKTIAIVVVLVSAVILVLAATRPDTFRVERSTNVEAPPERVQALIDDFHQWNRWSPWEKLDPAMRRTFGGPASGVDATYAWKSDGKAGEGRMRIVESSPASRIVIELDVIKPIPGHNRIAFTLTPDARETRVVWTMDGTSPFVAKVFGIFVSMDRLIGRDFETGLANLKAAAEKPA